MAGGGGATGYLVIDAGVRLDVVVEAGEVVVTSGGRSRFPADIPVGRVLDPDSTADLDREIIVEPAASLEHLSFLNVVLDPRLAEVGPRGQR
jgi:cell shape-determining protein MreC